MHVLDVWEDHVEPAVLYRVAKIPVAGVECDACAFDEWVLQLVVGG